MNRQVVNQDSMRKNDQAKQEILGFLRPGLGGIETELEMLGYGRRKVTAGI